MPITGLNIAMYASGSSQPTLGVAFREDSRPTSRVSRMVTKLKAKTDKVIDKALGKVVDKVLNKMIDDNNYDKGRLGRIVGAKIQERVLRETADEASDAEPEPELVLEQRPTRPLRPRLHRHSTYHQNAPPPYQSGVNHDNYPVRPTCRNQPDDNHSERPRALHGYQAHRYQPDRIHSVRRGRITLPDLGALSHERLTSHSISHYGNHDIRYNPDTGTWICSACMSETCRRTQEPDRGSDYPNHGPMSPLDRIAALGRDTRRRRRGGMEPTPVREVDGLPVPDYPPPPYSPRG